MYQGGDGTYHYKKYQNFPIVLGWKFNGNEQVSIGNLREMEFLFPLWEIMGNKSVYPQFPQKKCGEISSFFAVYK